MDKPRIRKRDEGSETAFIDAAEDTDCFIGPAIPKNHELELIGDAGFAPLFEDFILTDPCGERTVAQSLQLIKVVAEKCGGFCAIHPYRPKARRLTIVQSE